MEEFRDERLSRIMSWMQAWARGYLTRKTFKKLQEQRLALTVVQRSLRRYLKLRTWPWWKLWQKVKPLLNASRVEDQIAVSSRFTHRDFWFSAMKFDFFTTRSFPFTPLFQRNYLSFSRCRVQKAILKREKMWDFNSPCSSDVFHSYDPRFIFQNIFLNASVEMLNSNSYLNHHLCSFSIKRKKK